MSIYCKRALLLNLLIFAVVALSGCSALKTSISKRDLVVETKMSDSIFLDPVSSHKRTIYIETRNSTGKQSLDLMMPLKHSFVSKGFNVIDDPDKAQFWLRINVLNAGKTDPERAESILGAGYGGALTGAALGATVGGVAGGWKGAGIGGLTGAAIGGIGEVVADAFVEDVMFIVVSDVEIASKVKDGVVVQQSSSQSAKQGLGGNRVQTSNGVSNRNKYRLRVVSSANQVNLTFDEAIPELSSGLVRSLSGVF